MTMKWIGYETFKHGTVAIFEYAFNKRICISKKNLYGRINCLKMNQKDSTHEEQALANWPKEGL